MPAKNSLKQYVENSYYHIYNRGVEKRLIFLDEQDHGIFLSYLKEYLLPKNINFLQSIIASPTTPSKEKSRALKRLRLNNFHGEITLIAYSLMPNHFHFLIKQKSALSIDKFMNSLATRYTMYFNRKYKRVGALFQAVYKAVIVETDIQLLYLTKYLHRQALRKPRYFSAKKSASKGEALRSWKVVQPCSYPEYLGQRKTEWVKPDEVLYFFSRENPLLSYRAFIEEFEDLSMIQNITLE